MTAIRQSNRSRAILLHHLLLVEDIGDGVVIDKPTRSMRSIDSSGTNVSIRDNDNALSDDLNPYSYPYFRSHRHSSTVYDLVNRFGRLWREDVLDLDLLVKTIQKRAQSQPEEVKWKDSCGDTALHRLCQAARLPSDTQDIAVLGKTQYFVDICQCILTLHPTATIATNNWRETPLHQFVGHCGFASRVPDVMNDGSSLKILQNPIMTLFYQLARNGAAGLRNYWDSYPLHDACELQGLETTESKSMMRIVSNEFEESLHTLHLRMVDYLVQSCPSALTLRDDSNAAPLHRAVQSYACGPRVVEFLVKSLLQQRVSIASLAGESPLAILLKYYNDSTGKICASDMILEQLRQGKEPAKVAQQLGSLWTNTLTLCKAQVCGTLQPLQFHAIHALVQTKCPDCVIELTIRLWPNELLSFDERGETTLTSALALNSSWRILLQAEPRLASIQNSRELLPLHVAIHSRLSSWPDVLEHLFVAEPRSLTSRDATTGLYPFQLMASKTVSLMDLTATMELLKADPSTLQY